MVYQDTTFKICLSLFGWKENIQPKMHIVQWSLSLEIMCMHFILSGHHTSSHTCNHNCHKKLQHNFPKMSNICPHCFGASVTSTNVKSSRGPLSKTLCRPINPAQVCTALVLPSSSLHYCPQSELDRKTSKRFVLLGISDLKRCSRSVLVLVDKNRYQACIKSLQIPFHRYSQSEFYF